MEVTVNLEPQVVEVLEKWATPRGWTLGEAIRFLVGQHAASIVDMEDVLLKPVPFTTSVPEVKIPKFEDITKLMTLAGMLKCPNCTRSLTNEEVVAGICSQCDGNI